MKKPPTNGKDRPQRRSLSAADLTEQEIAAIERAEIPPTERYSLKDAE